MKKIIDHSGQQFKSNLDTIGRASSRNGNFKKALTLLEHSLQGLCREGKPMDGARRANRIQGQSPQVNGKFTKGRVRAHLNSHTYESEFSDMPKQECLAVLSSRGWSGRKR